MASWARARELAVGFAFTKPSATARLGSLRSVSETVYLGSYFQLAKGHRRPEAPESAAGFVFTNRRRPPNWVRCAARRNRRLGSYFQTRPVAFWAAATWLGSPAKSLGASKQDGYAARQAQTLASAVGSEDLQVFCCLNVRRGAIVLC